jgi:hypothetical protein
MEIIGFTAGIISLAGLFSTCIDAFAFLQAGQSLERDLKIVLVKLDIEKARLLSWGNAVGIARGVNDGRSSIFNNQVTEEIIRSILENIKHVLTDSQRLREKYALGEMSESPVAITATQRIDFVSRTSLYIFRGSYNRLCNRIAQNLPRVSPARRVTWAIRDRERFSDLVKDLRELVDGLVGLAPGPTQTDRIIEDDIASLRIDNLRLVEEATRNEEAYRGLSDTVSEAIQATELGTTVDHRDLEEWLADQIDPEATQARPSSPTLSWRMQVLREGKLNCHHWLLSC